MHSQISAAAKLFLRVRDRAIEHVEGRLKGRRRTRDGDVQAGLRLISRTLSVLYPTQSTLRDLFWSELESAERSDRSKAQRTLSPPHILPLDRTLRHRTPPIASYIRNDRQHKARLAAEEWQQQPHSPPAARHAQGGVFKVCQRPQHTQLVSAKGGE